MSAAPPSVIGSAFRLEWDAAMTMSWVGDDSSPYFKVGNAKDGAQIAYATCQFGTLVIDAVQMMSLGTSAPCSHLRLGPEPSLGLSAIYCNFTPIPILASDAIVNANGACTCTVSTEQTTWGAVKALYR